MARSLPKVCPFLVTVDLKLKWPELPRPTLHLNNYVTVLPVNFESGNYFGRTPQALFF